MRNRLSVIASGFRFWTAVIMLTLRFLGCLRNMVQPLCQTREESAKPALRSARVGRPSENRNRALPRRDSALRAINTRLARTTLAALALLTFAALPAAGQPSAADTMQAYRTVEGWIRAWDVPAEAQLLDPPETTAACVTLRLSGRVMGRATATTAGQSLWEAARRAWQEAASNLPVERDALRQENLRALAPQLMIDVQLAGPMTPITAGSLQEAAQNVSPGKQGVAVRAGERIEAVFPGFMLSTNMTPGDGLIAALGMLGLPPQDLAVLKRDAGLILYRFDVQHVAQAAPGEPPIFLTRGGRTVKTRQITPRTLRDFGDQLAANLVRRQWPGEEPFGLLGTYQPWLDEFEDAAPANAADQALAALALARWAQVSRNREDMHEASVAAAQWVLQKLADVGEGETSPNEDAVASSLMAMAYLTFLNPNQTAPNQGAPASAAPPQNGAANPPVVEAIRVNAVAMAARAHNNEGLAEDANNRIRALFQNTPPAQLPSLMPWLGWAELALLDDEERVPSAIALREFRDLVEEHQLSLLDVSSSGDEDLAGGIVFTSGGAALPTWQSIRPLIFLATMLGDERLTSPDERAAHLVRLLEGLRFVQQLTVDEAECHMFANPDRALGGVRLALWDQRQPVDSTALALLLVAESLESVEKMTGASR